MARAAADFHAVLYILVCLAVFLWDVFLNLEELPSYWLLKWLAVMIPLVIIFQKTYYHFTSKDPDKRDDDWTSDLD